MDQKIKSAYLAPEGLIEPLLKEVDGVVSVHDQLILSSKPFVNAHWAQNIWKNPLTLSIGSINDAAKKLKDIQRNWCLYSVMLHRRANLIEKRPQAPEH